MATNNLMYHGTIKCLYILGGIPINLKCHKMDQKKNYWHFWISPTFEIMLMTNYFNMAILSDQSLYYLFLYFKMAAKITV